MKKSYQFYGLIAIFSFFSVFVSAQSNSAAVKILSNTVGLIQKNGVQTNFNLVIKDQKTSETQKTSGSFLMKGNKFALKTNEMQVYFDGKTQWAYMPQINEVTITNPTEKELAETNPMALLQEYKSKSSINFSKGNADKSLYAIELIPVKNSTIKNILIKINKSTNYPAYLQITDKNGAVNTLNLLQFRKGVVVNENSFTFNPNKYKGIEINDLR